MLDDDRFDGRSRQRWSRRTTGALAGDEDNEDGSRSLETKMMMRLAPWSL